MAVKISSELQPFLKEFALVQLNLKVKFKSDSGWGAVELAQGLRVLRLLQGTPVQFPAPTSGDS